MNGLSLQASMGYVSDILMRPCMRTANGQERTMAVIKWKQDRSMLGGIHDKESISVDGAAAQRLLFQ